MTGIELVALGPIFKWVWDEYGKDIISKSFAKSSDVIKSKWNKAQIEKAAKAYTAEIKRQYGKMQIIGMAQPIPLEGIFTHVNVLTKPTAWRRYSIEQLTQSYLDEGRPFFSKDISERKSGLDTVKEITKLFVLGKPGSGKTTFLKYIALQAVEGKLERIPIFITLREFSDSGLSLVDFIAKQFEICDFPDAEPFIEKILKSGKAIVLFDGLDEVSNESEKRRKVIRAVTDFTNQYDLNQFIITCRIAATDYLFEHFTYVEIADFYEEQISIFVTKWFAANRVRRDQFLKEFKKEENRRLGELAQVPLLLALLCLVFDQTGKFPTKKAELYAEAFDILLEKWDKSRHVERDKVYHNLSVGRKKQMFAQIAYRTFEKGEYLFPQQQLEKWIINYLIKLTSDKEPEDINGKEILKAIEAQHGIFAERAVGIYSFSHLTFQEYFTAKFIVDNYQRGTIEGLVNNHLTDDRWHEVFLIIASMLENADHFLELFKTAIDRLLVDGNLIDVVRWAEKKANSLRIKYKTAAIRSFYMYPTFHIADDLARAHVSDLALAFDINLAQDLKLDLSGNLNLDFSRSLDLARAIDPKLDLDSDRNYDLDLDLALSYTYQMAQEEVTGLNISPLLNRVLELSKKLGLKELNQALRNLSIPNENSTKKDKQTFRNKLQAIMRKYRDIGYDWNNDEEKIKRLALYLTANKLLVDCLHLACVSERTKIEDGLLLTPQIEN